GRTKKQVVRGGSALHRKAFEQDPANVVRRRRGIGLDPSGIASYRLAGWNAVSARNRPNTQDEGRTVPLQTPNQMLDGPVGGDVTNRVARKKGASDIRSDPGVIQDHFRD